MIKIPEQLKDCKFCRVAFKTKKPFETDWVNKGYTYEEIQQYIDKENYGVICDKNIRAIDDDTPDKILIKKFHDTFGKTFRSRDHLCIKFTNGEDKKIIFKDKDGKHLGELQGKGQMIVGAGSMHPSGELYEVKDNSQIMEIEFELFKEVFQEFIQDVVDVGDVEKKDVEDFEELIKNFTVKWLEGSRQELALSLAGYLRKEKKLGSKTIGAIIREICNRAKDNEVEMRLKAVVETFKKNENEVKGYTGIKEIVKQDVARLVLERIALKKWDDASEILVNEIKSKYNIYTTKDDKISEMWIYEDGIYKPNGKSHIKEECRKILGKCYSAYIINLVVNKLEADTFIDQEEFFKNDYVDEIPVQNGILNVITLELSDFSPQKVFFNKLPVKYDPNQKCDNIDKFLRDILSKEEDVVVAYELIGQGLYKDYFMEKAGMLVGNGRNGKSKFLELIKRLMGVENTCSVPLRAMREDNSSLCELHNRLFNLAGDLSHTDLKETGCFKQTVGRDVLQAHRKFLRDLIFVNYAKHIFACNELPRVYDHTDGFWDKWILLEFPYKFESKKVYDKIPIDERKMVKLKDPKIIDNIASDIELSGLLNKALDGLHRLLKNKSFSQTRGSKEIKDIWIRKSDSFSAFCIDTIEEHYDSFITKKDLRKRYFRYCKQHKLKGSGDKGIKITLEERYGVIESRKYLHDEQERVWEGIKFKGDFIK